MKILVTGGAGYIGSLIAGALDKAGHEPVILDSLRGGRREFAERYPFYQGDIADESLLDRLFEGEGPLDGAVHCAALTIVPESVANPGEYYEENVVKTLSLFSSLQKHQCRRILLSGSASVYGNSRDAVLSEDGIPCPGSPYARTKLMQEFLLEDLCLAPGEGGIRGITLRYFNPLGAAEDLSSGPWRRGGSHLIARLLNHGPESPFVLTGTDFPTRDGTGLRDYFHAADLARAHVLLLESFDSITAETGYAVMNAGSGRGVTVKEFIDAFERVSGRRIDYRTGPARPGDVAGGYAHTGRLRALTGWEPRHSLEDAIESALLWEITSPLLLKAQLS
ncbi:MAG: UDP-glucose 4-epimerase GalE [Spirochaetales bacterium]|nr:UDP-glucose 4-epimerase GalE [Spirochaetales bacterium]